MPKNYVTDPITDQEITFAHLLLSGTMNDREAAETAGLNPTTAAYTKAKPRVREYMDEHRAAVSEKLKNLEAEGLRKLNLGRDQILARLWQLANLSPEATKNSIAGQVKSMAMIAAIEGLLPNNTNDRRRSPAPGQLASPAVNPQMFDSQTMPGNPAADMVPDQSVTATVSEAPQNAANHPLSVTGNRAHTSQASPFTDSRGVSWAFNAIGPDFNAYTDTTSPLRLPLAPGKQSFGRSR